MPIGPGPPLIAASFSADSQRFFGGLDHIEGGGALGALFLADDVLGARTAD
jgi:hypothetical protein